MNNSYLEKLEFDKVLKQLSNFCSTYLGKQSALNLRINNDKHIVKQKLAETEEAVRLIYKIQHLLLVIFRISKNI